MKQRALHKLPRSVWMLGFVSLFMDISSEMIHSVLPLFITVGLGASASVLGIIEGLAEATALLTKFFSGALSDWLGKRKALALFGYGLSALTKPLFASAWAIESVVTARVLDRVGKGIRGAPRDALVAELAPPQMRGAAFGLRQGLDTVGAFVGPLLAVIIMLGSAHNFRLVLWAAVLPGALAVLVLFLGVEEPDRQESAERRRVSFHGLFSLGRPFAVLMVISCLFSLARFSEAFLILKAADAGLPTYLAPLVLVVMNVVYSLSSYPAGKLSDTRGRPVVLQLALLFIIAADLLLSMTSGVAAFTVGLALWGLHMGFSQGVLGALVGDVVPSELRATAFGVQSLLSGLMLLFASVIAGHLWDHIGPFATFLAGAVCAAGALTLSLRAFSPNSFGPPGVVPPHPLVET